MADIIVTVPKGYFKSGRYAKSHFTLGGNRKPKRLRFRDRIYIVYEGLIEEFYEFMDYGLDDDSFEFHLGRQRQLVTPFTCKGFRGFRYADTIGLTRTRGGARRGRKDD